MEMSTDPFALVVDDDVMILMHASDILEVAGFRCLEAHSGDEAVSLLPTHAQSITLLFSDVQMPGATDGFALARHVAAHYPHIEIVIASGAIRPKEGDLPEKASFIPKPFSVEMVHEHLRCSLPEGAKPERLKRPA